MTDTPTPAPSGGTESPNCQGWPGREAVDGVCCTCGYHGTEETPCPSRSDKTHCVHWWEGDGEVTPPASAPGSGEEVAFVQDADCSHDRVMRVTQTIVGGAMAEWWQCGNCPARFELADSSRESMEDVVREVLCRAFEDGTELIPAFHEWYDASQWFWWGRALGAFIGTEARKREQRARDEGEAKGRREAEEWGHSLARVITEIGHHTIILGTAHNGTDFGHQVSRIKQPVDPKRWVYEPVAGTFGKTPVDAALAFAALAEGGGV